jgi:hypothetical protein
MKTKKKYTPKQRRMAEHIEKTYEKKGVPKGKAWAIAYATLRKYLGEGPDSKRICRLFL